MNLVRRRTLSRMMTRRITFAAALLSGLFAIGCSAEASPPPPAPVPSTSPTLHSAKVGAPFEVTQTFTDGSAPTQWRVVVSKLACAIGAIPKAASNPKWEGDDSVPEFVTATPAPGKEYCRVDAVVTNISTSPGYPQSFGDIVLSQGSFRQTADDEMVTTNINDALSDEMAVNPGEERQIAQVWSVPKGATAIAVLFPQASVVSGPTHRVAL